MLGYKHPCTLTGVNNPAGLPHAQGKLGEGGAAKTETLVAMCAMLCSLHPSALLSAYNLATLQEQGRLGEAKPLSTRHNGGGGMFW